MMLHAPEWHTPDPLTPGDEGLQHGTGSKNEPFISQCAYLYGDILFKEWVKS